MSSEEIRNRWEQINKLLTQNEISMSALKSQNAMLEGITEDLNADSLLLFLMEDISLQMGMDGGLLLSFESEVNQLHLKAHSGEGLEDLGFPIEVTEGQGVSAQSVLSKCPIFDDNIRSSKYFEKRKDLEKLADMGAIWAVPLMSHEQGRAGEYFCLFTKESRMPSKENLRVLEMANSMAKIVIEKEEAKLERADEQKKNFNDGKKAVLGEMAGGIAHEINNPLAIISSQAQKILLLNKLEKLDKASMVEGVEKILMTVDRISQITRALRIYSRDDTIVEKKTTADLHNN